MQREYAVGMCSASMMWRHACMVLTVYYLLLNAFGRPGFSTYLLGYLLEARGKFRLCADDALEATSLEFGAQVLHLHSSMQSV